MRVRILVEEFDGIDKRGTNDWITAYADTGGLPDLASSELADRFIGQCSAARNHTHVAFQMNMARHDSDFAFAGRDDSGAIGSDQPRSLSFEEGACPDHVECRNAFGDANDQFDAGGGRFHDRIGRIWRRYENDGGVGSRLAPRFFNRIEDIEAFMCDAAFGRRDSPHHVRPVLHGLNRVKRAFKTGDALNEQSCVVVDEYAHL